MTKLPVGTRIVFIKSLYGDADEFQPAHVFAEKGDHGQVVGHGAPEGYWVKRDSWRAPFGAVHGVEFIAHDRPKEET